MICPTCGQTQKLSHKETLSAQKIKMLKRAAEHVRSTMVNDFMVRDIATPEEFKTFNNFQKLRYSGLIAKVTNKQKGHWLITRNGWAFLRGDVELPQYVLIKNNHIESRADLLVGVREVLRGEATLQTNFEYFSESGEPIGFRPIVPQNTLFNQIGMRF